MGRREIRRPRFTQRGITAVLITVAAVSALGLMRAASDQVYFEPTTEALARAHEARQTSVVLAGVLLAVGFVATVLSDRVICLLNVLVALLAFFPGSGLVVAPGCVVVLLVDLGFLVALAVGSPGPDR